MFSHYPAHYTFDNDSDARRSVFTTFPNGNRPAINAKTLSWKRRKACAGRHRRRDGRRAAPARPFSSANR